jgi:hypothetical protein
MSTLARAALVGALTLAALAPAAGAQPVVQVVGGASKKPCPDTLLVSAVAPGTTARFVVRGATDGVVVIAPGVRTIRKDRGGVELEATTPAQVVLPQRDVRLVIAPRVASIGIQVDRAGRDSAGRTVYLNARGAEVALSRNGGTALQVIAEHVTLRDRPDQPMVSGRP